MKDLEKENLQLKTTIEKLKKDNQKKLKTISSLNTIAVSLTNFKDVSSILREILINIQDVVDSDGGTIYLTDGKKLSFKHIINKSLKIEHYDCDNNEKVWNFLDINKSNENLVAVNCALSKEIISINDIYNSSKYDFSGTKKFDKKIGYRSVSMLVVPMLLADNTLVGVLQLINKLDENDKIISFAKEDEELAQSLASQASVAIDKYRQEKLLIQQSKLAAMGEMIDAVAHQWKQPLNIVNIIASKIKMYINMNIPITDETLVELSDEVIVQIKHLTNTIDEFRLFLRPNRKKQKINIHKMVSSVINLLKNELVKHNVEVEIIGNDKLEILIIENEFQHIFINIINNAKDAFLDKNKLISKKIIIDVKENIDNIIITIDDNAGGIPNNIIDSIFQANVTTKEKGTGIGLYMSTQIVEKNNGTLSVENTKDGTKFTIKLIKEFFK